ncbi:MAG: hypothetical protein AB7E51_12825, partial [Pseudodesulfovibrio sp.]|uniref:hypothetical protein n=1 Tax=Pseudodesulfovibrio sp. TaxID=2035812 RepID=UPI003D0D98EC
LVSGQPDAHGVRHPFRAIARNGWAGKTPRTHTSPDLKRGHLHEDIGIVREQELFYEIAKIISTGGNPKPNTRG